MSSRIVIIGTGLAGYMLAKEFRKLNTDAELILVTAAKGHFYSKPQLSNALAKNQLPDQLVLTDATTMQTQLNAQLIAESTVTHINCADHYIEVGDARIAYDKLVIAHGAQVIAPKFAGDAQDELISVNHLEDYARFHNWLQSKRTIALIGTGLVGCEFMNDLLSEGKHVSLFSIDEAPLAQFIPTKLGHAFQNVFTEQGVHWHMQQPVTAINKVNDKLEVTTVDDSFQYDGVMTAIGLRVDLRLAQAAGLQVKQAIEVNRHLQTSDPDIYALGDCASVDGLVLQYIAPLLQCARSLANTLNDDKQAVAYPPLPVVIKTPTCPVVTLPPLPHYQGEWSFEGEGAHWRALFHDKDQQLHGFALMGRYTKERMQWVKLMPPVWW